MLDGASVGHVPKRIYFDKIRFRDDTCPVGLHIVSTEGTY